MNDEEKGEEKLIESFETASSSWGHTTMSILLAKLESHATNFQDRPEVIGSLPYCHVHKVSTKRALQVH